MSLTHLLRVDQTPSQKVIYFCVGAASFLGHTTYDPLIIPMNYSEPQKSIEKTSEPFDKESFSTMFAAAYCGLYDKNIPKD